MRGISKSRSSDVLFGKWLPTSIELIGEIPPGMADLVDSPTTTEQPPDTVTTDISLSKSARKKAKKAERYAVLKLERRAREKEARREKQRIRAEKRAAGEADDDDGEQRRQKKKVKIAFGGRVVIDLGFDHKMTVKEITSLCSQLAYTYSANRNASYPFNLLFTSLNGRTFTRLESMNDAGYKRWMETVWWSESYDQLWLRHQLPEVQGPQISEENISDTDPTNKSEATDASSSRNPVIIQTVVRAAQETVVYLTADSEHELLELKPDETYIIGGICDHNRYKNLCLNKAAESGIRTARLPIGRYLASLPTRKVLTVNQVFEIMVKWVETRSWEEALYSIVPKRKFQTGGGVFKAGFACTLIIAGVHCKVLSEEHDAKERVDKHLNARRNKASYRKFLTIATG